MTGSTVVDAEIIVLDLDGGTMLEECLRSLASQSVIAKRIVVFDNGSRDPVAKRLEGFGVDVTVLRSETNIGVARGFNEAIRTCTATWVALVNNDVVLEPGWLESMVATIESNHRIAAVQAIVGQGDRATVDGTGIGFVNGKIVQRDHGLPLASATRSAPWGVSATAALYRLSALREVATSEGEVFFSKFFAYYEDVELAARLAARGWVTGLFPEILAWHRGSSTASSLGGYGERLRVRNRYWLARRHRGCGSIPSLMVEDAKRIARYLADGRLGPAFLVPLAMVEGLLGSFRTSPDKSGELG